MSERWRNGTIGRRMLGALLVVSLSSLGVLVVGTVVPHLVARAGHREAVDTPWLLAATAVAVLTAIVASVVVARRTVAPMDRIVTSARAFAGGDHSIRLPDFGRPELVELVDTLNSAAEEVERSERGRQRLTADIAHELRTPLTALQAGLEELRDGLVEPDRKTLDALHSQTARLGRIITDLWELADAESEVLQLTRGPVDLGCVAAAAVAEREHAMAAAGLVVRRTIAEDVVVTGDMDRLHQVVGNLLANCTAYCRPGDTVDVRVAAAPGHAVLEVADSGPGIDDAERPHAFDRRWRGQSAEATPGSGLGLPIVQALVVAQGGTVRLSAASPSGTVVRIELPLAADSEGVRIASAGPAR